MHLDLTEEDIELLDKDGRLGWLVGKYTIIGMLPHVTGKHKRYVVKCPDCAKDPYLFGLGIFTARYADMKKGTSCGCGGKFLYTETLQYKRAKRIVENFGFKFNGFSGEFKGNETRCIVECPEHGENTNNTVHSMVAIDRPTCPVCWPLKLGIIRSGTYDYNVKKFMASGGFHEDTVFYRSERKTPTGQNSYWFMICGECGSVGESYTSHLNRGVRSCSCKKDRQRQAYINLVYNENDTPIALKFGIANSAGYRINSQNRQNTFRSRQYDVYQFDTKFACAAAEREVKSKVEVGILTKEEFPDGYTETTGLENLIEIQKIYKKHGGVSIMNIVNDTYLDGCVAFVETTVFDVNFMAESSSYFRTKPFSLA